MMSATERRVLTSVSLSAIYASRNHFAVSEDVFLLRMVWIAVDQAAVYIEHLGRRVGSAALEHVSFLRGAVRDEALARARSVYDRAAAVGERGVPDEQVAFFRHERRFAQAAQLRLLFDEAGEVELAVFRLGG